MVQQMENQNKSDKISASYIHHEAYKLPANYQQYKNNGSDRSKILGFIPRPNTDMAETHQYEVSEVKLKDYEKCPDFWAANPSYP
ncbi:hypothetical protein B7P43_G06070 [Cryptotermes secundus]|uniref:Uncharacterized protein n=1 Tax=Cryptotermes secundus TaxID=105785 RepID=A0A2J7PKL7_9NEOP|nr:hypothetical protein B7P43_G06070 [Cryptotermes secundus]